MQIGSDLNPNENEMGQMDMCIAVPMFSHKLRINSKITSSSVPRALTSAATDAVFFWRSKHSAG